MVWKVLEEDQVVEIKEKLASGRTGSSLAKEYSVSEWIIYGIKSGRTWKYLNNERYYNLRKEKLKQQKDKENE